MFLLLWILIQIIGESLPISSSGHVELAQRLFHVSLQNFENIHFLLHGPTIIILLICFFTAWWQLIFKTEDMDPRLPLTPLAMADSVAACPSKLLSEDRRDEGRVDSPHPRFSRGSMSSFFLKNLFYSARFIIIADIITFIFWILNLSQLSFIQNYFLPIGFFITICCLYFSQFASGSKKVAWSLGDAIFLGIIQGLCLLPGISRFAGTYAAGLWLGYDRKHSIAISFLIQFPLLCAAFLKGMLVMHDQQIIVQIFSSNLILFSIAIASLVSYALFCWVIKLIEQNRLWYFAFYMMIPMSLSLWTIKDVVT